MPPRPQARAHAIQGRLRTARGTAARRRAEAGARRRHGRQRRRPRDGKPPGGIRGEVRITGEIGTQMGQLSSALDAFGIRHASKGLPDLLEVAERNDLTNREFLARLLECEVDGRNARKRKRNYAAAHFPPGVRPLEEFDPTELEGGITGGQLAQLADLGWLDAHGNVVLAGPPGLGKTMIALGLGLRAIDEGCTVAFERMESLIDILDKADVDRKSGFRLRYLRRAQLVIIDEIGHAPIRKDQANKLLGFVSDAYERASMVFTTNKEITQWEELMGDQVLTTAMIDRIARHNRLAGLDGASHRMEEALMLGKGKRP